LTFKRKPKNTVRKVPKDAKPIATDGTRTLYVLDENTGYVESLREKGKWLVVNPVSFLRFGVWQPVQKYDITKINNLKVKD
jgi:hypothetical protein